MASRTFTAAVAALPQLTPPAALIHSGPRVEVLLYRGSYEPQVKGLALIDTGSGHSVIALEAVKLLRLPAVGEALVQTQGGPRDATLYPCELHIEDSGLPRIRLVSAVGSPYLVRSGLAAIIGRDALKNARFVYEGLTGRFTLEVPGV